MQPWRTEALRLLPELEEEIENANSPMGLWIHIYSEFTRAYDENPFDEKPLGKDFIRRVYAFADWCREQPQTPGVTAEWDPWTSVVTCFYEYPQQPCRAGRNAALLHTEAR